MANDKTPTKRLPRRERVKDKLISVRYKTMTFWNLVLLSVPNDRSHRGVFGKINPFSRIRIFFEIWAIIFNREISPADRPNHFKENTSFV